MKRRKHKEKDLLRINKKYISFNNKELGALKYYCKKYGIQNQSKFMREVVISEVLKKFDEDYPKLFEVELEQPTLF